MVSIGQMLLFAMLTPSAHLEAGLEMREPGWPPTPRELPASASGVLSEIRCAPPGWVGGRDWQQLVIASTGQSGEQRKSYLMHAGTLSARVNARLHSELPGAFPFQPGPTHDCESILR